MNQRRLILTTRLRSATRLGPLLTNKLSTRMAGTLLSRLWEENKVWWICSPKRTKRIARFYSISGRRMQFINCSIWCACSCLTTVRINLRYGDCLLVHFFAYFGNRIQFPFHFILSIENITRTFSRCSSYRISRLLIFWMQMSFILQKFWVKSSLLPCASTTKKPISSSLPSAMTQPLKLQCWPKWTKVATLSTFLANGSAPTKLSGRTGFSLVRIITT